MHFQIQPCTYTRPTQVTNPDDRPTFQTAEEAAKWLISLKPSAYEDKIEVTFIINNLGFAALLPEPRTATGGTTPSGQEHWHLPHAKLRCYTSNEAIIPLAKELGNALLKEFNGCEIDLSRLCINTNGENLIALGTVIEDKEQPTWSPSINHLMYF